MHNVFLLRQSYDDDESMGACAPTRLMIYIFDSFSLDTGYLRGVSHPEFNLSLSASQPLKSIVRMCQMPDNFTSHRRLFSLLVHCTAYISVEYVCPVASLSEQATANHVNASLGIQIGTMSRREF